MNSRSNQRIQRTVFAQRARLAADPQRYEPEKNIEIRFIAIETNKLGKEKVKNAIRKYKNNK